jgi:hypothetical protein
MKPWAVAIAVASELVLRGLALAADPPVRSSNRSSKEGSAHEDLSILRSNRR